MPPAEYRNTQHSPDTNTMHPNKLTTLTPANNKLLKITDTDETDIIFIQEPYEYQNRPAGTGNKYRKFTAGTGKHSLQ